MIKKYYRENGDVAVLVSPGWGAGWYTWNTDNEQLLYSPELVQAVLDGKEEDELVNLSKELFPDAYSGGLDRIQVRWLTPGTRFTVEEFDGAEMLRTVEDLVLIA